MSSIPNQLATIQATLLAKGFHSARASMYIRPCDEYGSAWTLDVDYRVSEGDATTQLLYRNDAADNWAATELFDEAMAAIAALAPIDALRSFTVNERIAAVIDAENKRDEPDAVTLFAMRSLITDRNERLLGYTHALPDSLHGRMYIDPD